MLTASQSFLSSLFACGMYELLSNHELTPRGWVTMTQQSDQFKSDPSQQQRYQC